MNDGMWFAAKRVGYGAGLPIAWQGWVVLGGMIGATLALSLALVHTHPDLVAPVVIGINLLPLPLVRAKTRGGWKWRNGRE